MSKSIRLFFALWPNPEVRTQLIQLANGIQHDRNARLTRKSNLHVTLHFIGNTSTELLPCYIEQASTLKFQPFSFTLGQLGYFKKPKILWIGPDQAPTQLYLLHEQLGIALNRCNYEPEARQYRPHVTLFRKANPIENHNGKLEAPEISWTVEHFSLIKSEPAENGVIYTEIERFKGA